MGLLGEMIAGGVAGYAGSRYDDMEKQIAMERQQALEEMRLDKMKKAKDEERTSQVKRFQDEAEQITNKRKGLIGAGFDKDQSAYDALSDDQLNGANREEINAVIARNKQAAMDQGGAITAADARAIYSRTGDDLSGKIADRMSQEEQLREAREDKLDMKHEQIEQNAALVREKIEAQKEMLRERMAMQKQLAAIAVESRKAGAGASGQFVFDASKQRDHAEAMVGLNKNELKIFDDPEKFAALPADRQEGIQNKIRQADELLKTAAQHNAPVDVVYRHFMKAKAEREADGRMNSAAQNVSEDARRASSQRSAADRKAAIDRLISPYGR